MILRPLSYAFGLVGLAFVIAGSLAADSSSAALILGGMGAILAWAVTGIIATGLEQGRDQ
jgi:hypothetical protein